MKVISLFCYSVLNTCLLSQNLNIAIQDYDDPIHFIKLHVFIDKSVVEVFINGRQLWPKEISDPCQQ